MSFALYRPLSAAPANGCRPEHRPVPEILGAAEHWATLQFNQPLALGPGQLRTPSPFYSSHPNSPSVWDFDSSGSELSGGSLGPDIPGGSSEQSFQRQTQPRFFTSPQESYTYREERRSYQQAIRRRSNEQRELNRNRIVRYSVPAPSRTSLPQLDGSGRPIFRAPASTEPSRSAEPQTATVTKAPQFQYIDLFVLTGQDIAFVQKYGCVRTFDEIFRPCRRNGCKTTARCSRAPTQNTKVNRATYIYAASVNAETLASARGDATSASPSSGPHDAPRRRPLQSTPIGRVQPESQPELSPHDRFVGSFSVDFYIQAAEYGVFVSGAHTPSPEQQQQQQEPFDLVDRAASPTYRLSRASFGGRRPSTAPLDDAAARRQGAAGAGEEEEGVLRAGGGGGERR